MAQEIVINPRKCIGCASCSLTCSITWTDQFSPEIGFIKIKKHDLTGVYEISFSSECRLCKRCAQVCPAGALRVVEVEEIEKEKSS